MSVKNEGDLLPLYEHSYRKALSLETDWLERVIHLLTFASEPSNITQDNFASHMIELTEASKHLLKAHQKRLGYEICLIRSAHVMLEHIEASRKEGLCDDKKNGQ